MKVIKFLDTTLRDGEQTPGIALSVKDKVKIAQAIDELNVDAIEAGSAVASEGEREAIKEIVKSNLKSQIFSFSRLNIKDINYALECGVDGIFLVAPTSQLHLKYKLMISREKLKEKILECVKFCKKNNLKVDLCCEDGSRTDINFLKEIINLAINLDVECFTVADTVGIATPEKISKIFQVLKDEKNSKKAKILLGVHCHDDFGLAAANTLAAVKNGADIVDVTMIGLGERAGNAALEEVSAALKFLYNYDVKINFKKILETSSLIEKITGIGIAKNKPIVGENAFTHGAGIHVNGIIKNPKTYESINPKIFNTERKFVLGKLMGKDTIKSILSEMKIKVSEDKINEICSQLKSMADKGKRLTSYDVKQVADSVLHISRKKKIILRGLAAFSGYVTQPMASVTLLITDGEKQVEKKAVATGDGPVDAAINAIRNICSDIPFEFLEYHVDAITGGSDAAVRVDIKLKSKGKIFTANSVGTDIVVASVEAFINGLNLISEIE
ncbi:MAG: alpha-isopropylmalate synthase regulatory domain-containing protein [Candidatus Aenigmatarchaeota archaeon]